MLSQQTIHELRKELLTLRERATAIEAVLEGANGWHGEKRRGRKPREVPKMAETAEKTTTFAGDVRRALRAIGRTTTNKEIAKWLDAHGGSEHTTRELRGAVAVELYRMAKKKLGVKKVSRGKYRIEEETGPTPG